MLGLGRAFSKPESDCPARLRRRMNVFLPKTQAFRAGGLKDPGFGADPGQIECDDQLAHLLPCRDMGHGQRDADAPSAAGRAWSAPSETIRGRSRGRRSRARRESRCVRPANRAPRTGGACCALPRRKCGCASPPSRARACAPAAASCGNPRRSRCRGSGPCTLKLAGSMRASRSKSTKLSFIGVTSVSASAWARRDSGVSEPGVSIRTIFAAARDLCEDASRNSLCLGLGRRIERAARERARP